MLIKKLFLNKNLHIVYLNVLQNIYDIHTYINIDERH